MTLEELKLRQLTNQYLITPADKMTVVRDLCGIQAQFMVNAMHSLKIRCSDYDDATVSDGLVKNWTVRGTVHVFAEDDLALFKHCDNGKNYRNDNWSGYSTWQKLDGTCKRCWALTPEKQRFYAHVILKALETDTYTRDELKLICREAGMTELEESAMFDQWGGGIRDLCERGFMNYVVQEKKAYCLSPMFTPIPEAEANLEIARRYFTNIAPATIHDAMYFFHATAAQVKAWLAELPVTSVECGGKTYYYIENGKSYNADIPRCLFLAGFDQLMLGYEKKESLYLAPEHLRAIFNLAGIVMPPVMLNGRVVGKWKKKNRKLTVELFDNVQESGIAAIKAKAESLWSELTAIEVLTR
ncbi:MAG: winged helix DNA-binding domain-containing protein [Clostridia bacterium]|nr:winged helix DNA-binding domain-containing protein [Clostridia bacterium]